MSYEKDIMPLRDKINQINSEIMDLLQERVKVALEIAKVKRSYEKPIIDKAREAKVIKQVKTLAEEKGLDPEGVVKVFKEIITLCVEEEL
jgi:chorismate mutase